MSRATALAIAGLVSLSTVSWVARAQTEDGFSANRFEPAEQGSAWFVAESLDYRGHGRLAAGVVLDYANNALVAYDRAGTLAARILRHQGYVHLGASLVLFERLRLGASMPLLVLNRGQAISTPDGNFANDQGIAPGDARLGADVRIWGAHRAPFSLATGAQLHLPTGNQAAYASDGTVRLQPRLMAAGDIGTFSYGVSIGTHLRPVDARFAGSRVGHEVTMTTAAGLRFLDRTLLVGPELRGSSVASDLLNEGSTPLEALLGAHYSFADGWTVSSGAGPGLTQGIGSPRLRVVAGLQWAAAQQAPPPRDTDRDAIVDSLDLCPTEPVGSTPDPARLGCPLRDKDGDGIADSLDACPTTRGEPSPDTKQHGCPPIVEQNTDRDADGIPDSLDACPDEKGVPSANREAHGCRPARLERALQQIQILQRIEFEYDSDRLVGQSESVIQAVHDILMEHPEFTLLEVQGHTDNVGASSYNTQLSERRARTVRRWLITHGIDSEHLTAVGYGQDRPLASNDSAEGRQANRRVEFHILEENGNTISSVESPTQSGAPANTLPDASSGDGIPSGKP